MKIQWVFAGRATSLPPATGPRQIDGALLRFAFFAPRVLQNFFYRPFALLSQGAEDAKRAGVECHDIDNSFC